MEQRMVADDGDVDEQSDAFVASSRYTTHTAHSGKRSGMAPGRAELLKVSSHSRPSAVAGAIAGVIRQAGRAEIQAIGAGAVNQAIKAIAIARSYLQEEGIDVHFIPTFLDVVIAAEERTALRLLVEMRPS